GLQGGQARVALAGVFGIGAERLGQVGGGAERGAGEEGVEALGGLAAVRRAVGQALAGEGLGDAGEGQADRAEAVAAGGGGGVGGKAGGGLDLQGQGPQPDGAVEGLQVELIGGLGGGEAEGGSGRVERAL